MVLPTYKKYKLRREIESSNIFFDTNKSNLIVEYSKCKNYFRLIKTDGTASLWNRINENSGLRVSPNNRYWYNSNGRCITFPIF